MTRQCGGCTLCCKLTPVEEIQKHAGQRCKHQRTGVGCSIYEKRPLSCRTWSCMWLLDPVGTKDLSRPDRSHYVIDLVPDTITMTFDNGTKIEVVVMQVWCDPKFPDAHRDPALREMAEKHGIVLLVRYDSEKGMAVFPPSRNAEKQWVETEVNECDYTRLDPFRKALMKLMNGEHDAETDRIAALLGSDLPADA